MGIRSYLATYRRSSPLKSVWLAGGLVLLSPERAARAEDALRYKFQAWQEDAGRVEVLAHYALAEKDLSPNMRLRFTGLLDAITGATPTGEPAETRDGPVPLTEIKDDRRAGSLDLTHQFSRLGITAGYARSTESDYVSDGVSATALVDFNQKQTLLRVGVSGTWDEVKVFYTDAWQDKMSVDVILGVTQVINATTTLTANLTYGQAEGYLNDPYKIIRKDTEILPGLFLPLTFAENRPDERRKWIGYLAFNHAWPEQHGAFEATYRFYHDGYGIDSHTMTAGWRQTFQDGRWTLNPHVRAYRQSAADFYRVTLDGTDITPTVQPQPAGPFYSADYRLAELDTFSAGVTLTWKIRDGLAVDATYDRYVMHGRDGVTSAQAFPDADVFTVGVKVWR